MLLRFKFNFEILNKDLAVGIIRTNNPGTSTGFAANTQKDGIDNSTCVSKVKQQTTDKAPFEKCK